MDGIVSQHQMHYQDHSRPSSSSSSSSMLDHQLAYPPSSQSSLAFQQHYARKESPNSTLQITTGNSNPADHDADEQTAHPSRMQPQFPPTTSDPQSMKSLMTGFSRILTHREQELLNHLDRLKFFLATAPSRWNSEESDEADPSTLPVGHPSSAHPALNRFLLPNSEYVSCVLWGGLYHITGTDIVRALVFRFEAFGRPVRNMKKFEEGVFSDLRNLKPGTDACLEEPKSPFLDLLFKYQCIRTQKKQKVFYWFSVPHDRLFLDALERDLKREKMGLEPTTGVAGEPALSFTYDPKRSLYEQFCKAQGGYEGEGELEAAVRRADELTDDGEDEKSCSENGSSADEVSLKKKIPPTLLNNPNTPFASMFSLFEGSPTYKQRRKKTTKKGSTDSTGRSGSVDEGTPPNAPVRDTTRMTAADMFMAQARDPRAAAIQSETQHLQPQPVRGRLEQRSTYPVNNQGYPNQQNSHRQQLVHTHSATLPGDWPYMDSNHTTDVMPMASPPASARTKAFVCPLFSCGRMFKRMEHLKRHLRTHTMERPFQCQRCNKKFSRSDNLNQHIRIHMRMDAEGTNAAAGFMNGMVDDNIFDDGVNADVEDVDELDGDDASFLADARMCEVEVQGNVHDVQGDEEGLVTTDPMGYIPTSDTSVTAAQVHPSAYYSGGHNGAVASPFPLSTSPEPATYSADTSSAVPWMMSRQTHSPAFSSASMPSPQPQSRMSSVGPTGPYNPMGEYMTSTSAPSHKATFDHSSIYGIQHSMSPGPGPTRRHRSVTPSLARYGESIRRPYSAAMSDVIPTASSRSYHPYAVPASSSHSGSAQSSPGSYNIPLDYATTMTGQMPITISRSGSDHSSRSNSLHLQDQMSQMLNLDSMENEGMGYTSDNGSVYGGLYRTDSPGSYATSTHGVYTGGNSAAVSSIYGMQAQAHYGNGNHQAVEHPFYGQGQPQSVPM